MGESVQISDLVLVDFHSKHLTPEIQEWKQKASVPFAESCARQIWYGRKEDFQDFPYPENPGGKIKTLHGAQAYSALLRLISGFESNRVGETHVKSQFFEGWRCFNDEFPEVAEGYQRLIGYLNEDVNFIRNDIAGGFKYQRHELSARDISEQKRGDQLLVIGSLGKGGNLSMFTEGIIRVSENRQKNKDNFMTVTHPDPEVLKVLASRLEAMSNDGILRSEIAVRPFEEIGRLLETTDRVYVDIPMGSDQQNEAMIIQAWQDRVRRDNTMTHLRGDPLNRALSSPQWAEAGLDNYFGPEEIRADMAERGRTNRRILENVEAAADLCGNLRNEGQKPKNRIVQSSDLTLSLKPRSEAPQPDDLS